MCMFCTDHPMQALANRALAIHQQGPRGAHYENSGLQFVFFFEKTDSGFRGRLFLVLEKNLQPGILENVDHAKI